MLACWCNLHRLLQRAPEANQYRVVVCVSRSIFLEPTLWESELIFHQDLGMGSLPSPQFFVVKMFSFVVLIDEYELLSSTDTQSGMVR